MSTPAKKDSSAAQEETVTLSKAELEKLNKRIKDNRDQALAAQQAAAELKKEKAVLLKELNSVSLATAALPADEAKRLDELKYSDPDAWLEEVTALKGKSQSTLESTLAEARKAAGEEIKKQTEQEAINSFITANPNIKLEDLETKVPYGLKASFDSGEITVQQFLDEANKFFNAKESSGGQQTLNQITLKDLSGTAQASKDAVSKESAVSYETATF